MVIFRSYVIVYQRVTVFKKNIHHFTNTAHHHQHHITSPIFRALVAELLSRLDLIAIHQDLLHVHIDAHELVALLRKRPKRGRVHPRYIKP